MIAVFILVGAAVLVSDQICEWEKQGGYDITE